MAEQPSALIEQLRREFIAVLQDAEPQIDALLAEVRFGLDENRTYRDLQEIAHRQAGTALTLHYTAIGEAAQAVDLAIEHGERGSRLIELLESWTHARSAVTGSRPA